MTRETESKIRAVLSKHLDAACDEICRDEIGELWWPAGYVERLAEQATQSLALMVETCDMTTEAEREKP